MTGAVIQRGFRTIMMNLSFSGLGKWAAVTVVAGALAFGAVAPTLAQEIAPETLALARKYVDLSDKQFIYEAILVKTAAATSKLLSQSNPDITDKIDAAIVKILDQYKGKKDDLFNQFARVYATTFTQDELQQIVNFYSSPAGQKLASSAQAVNLSIRDVMSVYTYNFGTEFVTKVRAELKAEGYKL